MSKYRRAAKVDKNQPEIVAALRKLGYSVSLDHDDILVGHQGKNYWFEIKGSKQTEIKSSQKKLAAEWKGHYKIVYSLDEILDSIGADERGRREGA